MRKPKKQKKPLNDLSRSLTPFDPNQTLITVIELSKKTWLVAGIIPGVERQPLKKLAPDEDELLKLLADSRPLRTGVNRLRTTS
jgi:transposase